MIMKIDRYTQFILTLLSIQFFVYLLLQFVQPDPLEAASEKRIGKYQISAWGELNEHGYYIIDTETGKIYNQRR